MSTLIDQFHPQLSPHIYLKNNFKIGLFLKKAGNMPQLLSSSVVYKCTCECSEESYIGSTKPQLFCRCAQHFGGFHRTGRLLTSPVKSSIRAHSEALDHRLKLSNFTIVNSCNDSTDLRILESLYITRLKLHLNEQQLAGSLHIALWRP